MKRLAYLSNCASSGRHANGACIPGMPLCRTLNLAICVPLPARRSIVRHHSVLCGSQSGQCMQLAILTVPVVARVARCGSKHLVRSAGCVRRLTPLGRPGITLGEALVGREDLMLLCLCVLVVTRVLRRGWERRDSETPTVGDGRCLSRTAVVCMCRRVLRRTVRSRRDRTEAVGGRGCHEEESGGWERVDRGVSCRESVLWERPRAIEVIAWTRIVADRVACRRSNEVCWGSKGYSALVRMKSRRVIELTWRCRRRL